MLNGRNMTDCNTMPRHVAVIMDGNGRWAKKRGLPRQMGHKKGCETVEQIVEELLKLAGKQPDET